MYCSIANNNVESEVLKRTKGLSKKQFYLRTRRLLQVGFVKRSKGSFSLANFGIVVFHAPSSSQASRIIKSSKGLIQFSQQEE